jgi:hypothetical protein
MRAADATNCVRLRYVQHGGLNISDRYRPDHRRALVEQDIGFACAHADDQATAAVNIGDVLVRNDWQANIVHQYVHGWETRGSRSRPGFRRQVGSNTVRRIAGPDRFIYLLLRRPFTIAAAPSFASVVAMVRPIPAVDPVTRAACSAH